MKYRGNIIENVIAGSIAEEAGIEAGDLLVAINGEKVVDVFDYRFFVANENITLEVLKKDGETWEIEIEKEEYEDLGLEFLEPMLDKARNCSNNCIFCFIDQLPIGMRETLYFKDDDTRLSFLTGNYVTLTNISIDDIDKIIRYRMSPINVSVHTTNPDLRVLMLRNKRAGDVLGKIKRLVDGGITVNSQIVLCKGINDGTELDRTIEDLAGMYPGVASISVVPVGITRHRGSLYKLEPYDLKSSLQVVSQVEDRQRNLAEKTGSNIVFLADEFYLSASVKIPEYEHYEEFPQIENGVGLTAMLRHEFFEYLNEVMPSLPAALRNQKGGVKSGYSRKVSIATGISSYKSIRELSDILQEHFDGLEVNIYEIKNMFFGENVTVTGLLTGKDIVGQVKGKALGEELLICSCMLKAGEQVLLDGYTPEMMETELGVKLTVVKNEGKDFVDKILGLC